MNKPRKWWIAALLSLLEPGVGQIYNGQGRKGLILLVLQLFFLPLLALACFSERFVTSLAGLILLSLGFTIFVIGDAIVNARRQRDSYTLKRYNRVLVYLGAILLTGGVSTALGGYIRSHVVQAFKIPSASDEPTLLVGDQILVDCHPEARLPKRGDIVVFDFPDDSGRVFVKRVVAIGGDRVEMRQKELWLNGEPQNEPYIVYREATLLDAEHSPRDNFGPIEVPQGTYFMMGDNRDRSYDSRFWGVVEQSKIKGKVMRIYWSWDRKRGAVRWDRIGTEIDSAAGTVQLSHID